MFVHFESPSLHRRVCYHDKMGSAGVQDSWAAYDRVGSQEV